MAICAGVTRAGKRCQQSCVSALPLFPLLSSLFLLALAFVACAALQGLLWYCREGRMEAATSKCYNVVCAKKKHYKMICFFKWNRTKSVRKRTAHTTVVCANTFSQEKYVKFSIGEISKVQWRGMRQQISRRQKKTYKNIPLLVLVQWRPI